MSDEQLPLFGPRPGKVRHDATDTSRDAAEDVKPVTGKQRKRVLEYIVGCGEKGATDPELQAALDLNGSSERPRRIELVEAGRVVDSGRRRNRCIVWVAV